MVKIVSIRRHWWQFWKPKLEFDNHPKDEPEEGVSMETIMAFEKERWKNDNRSN